MVILTLSTHEQCEAYTNNEMIPLLGNLSPPFREFFFREGGVLMQWKPIYWIMDGNAPQSLILHDGENGHVIEDVGSNSLIIVLKQIPSREDHVFIAAHELGHVLLAREGFPFPRKFHGNVNLASSLYAMIQDPLVNSRLLRYGFNVIEHYSANVSSSLRDLAERTSPTDVLDRLLWCCNIVGILLDGEYSRAGKIKEEFQKWLYGKFPDLVPEITLLYSSVKQVGFDTPEQQQRLLRKLSRQYHLYDLSRESEQ